jgi:hypothetical protein
MIARSSKSYSSYTAGLSFSGGILTAFSWRQHLPNIDCSLLASSLSCHLAMLVCALAVKYPQDFNNAKK